MCLPFDCLRRTVASISIQGRKVNVFIAIPDAGTFSNKVARCITRDSGNERDVSHCTTTVDHVRKWSVAVVLGRSGRYLLIQVEDVGSPPVPCLLRVVSLNLFR